MSLDYLKVRIVFWYQNYKSLSAYFICEGEFCTTLWYGLARTREEHKEKKTIAQKKLCQK